MVARDGTIAVMILPMEGDMKETRITVKETRITKTDILITSWVLRVLLGQLPHKWWRRKLGFMFDIECITIKSDYSMTDNVEEIKFTAEGRAFCINLRRFECVGHLRHDRTKPKEWLAVGTWTLITSDYSGPVAIGPVVSV